MRIKNQFLGEKPATQKNHFLNNVVVCVKYSIVLLCTRGPHCSDQTGPAGGGGGGAGSEVGEWRGQAGGQVTESWD